MKDLYACPICGKPRPWHVWFSRDGKGCYHRPLSDPSPSVVSTDDRPSSIGPEDQS